MKNWQRWLLTLFLGGLGGMISVATDPMGHTAADYFRHALIGEAVATDLLPTLRRRYRIAECSVFLSAE